MKVYCKFCKKFFSCDTPDYRPESGCRYFEYVKRKRFVLLHHSLETGHISIVAFSDSIDELVEVKLSHPRYGSLRDDLFVVDNVSSCDSTSLTLVKDKSLLKICKNVAQYLAVGEYALLTKSYFKSASWFEKAKNSAALGSEIIDNY